MALGVAAHMWAGPVEFGLAELQKALQEAKVPAGRVRIAAEVWPGTKSDAFEIVPWRVSGGDIRGLMYGLLEASDQIRKSGKLTPMKVEPAAAVRGIRIVLRDAEWEKTRLHDRGFWESYFARLARTRFNRIQIELGEPKWEAPQLPYLFSLPFFERVEVDGLTAFERGRNLDALRVIAQTAAGYGVDVSLGLHLGKTGTRVKGLSDEFRTPYVRAALPHLLEAAPSIRAVAVHEATDEMLREAVIPSLQSAGHLVTLEIHDRTGMPAREVGVAVRLFEPLARGVAVPDLAKLRARENGVIRLVAASRYTDPAYVRRVASGVLLGGALGFEVEGSMDLDSAEALLLHEAWGRLGYQPAAVVAAEKTEMAPPIICAARVENPESAMRELQDCSVILEATERPEWKALAQQASMRVRLLWARRMEEHYEATKHESALRAAFYSYRAAARTAPERQADVERLEKMIAQLEPNPELGAMPWTVAASQPSIGHMPAAVALTGQPLVVVVNYAANARVTGVRMHYRIIGGAEGFRTLEAPAKAPRFTIAAAELGSAGQLVYWFELTHSGGVWRVPAEQAALPVFVTVLKAPPPKEEEASEPKGSTQK